MIRTLLLLAALVCASSAFGSVPEKIQRVEINGVTAFSKSEIEAALEVGPGDDLDRGKVLRTVENLTSLYHTHGYDSAEVSERIEPVKTRGVPEVIVIYDVSEGKPTLVSWVTLDLAHPADPVLQRYWLKLEPQLRKKISIATGDLLNRDRVANAQHALQETLNSEEFIGARVENVKIVPGTEPAGWKGKILPEKWMGLEFHVDLGDRVTFGFRGNHAISASRLSQIIAEEKVLGLGKDYIDAIRTRFEDEYRSLGFAHVSIEAFPFEHPKTHERHITYFIHEGPRVRIAHVRFDGNTVFSDHELRGKFFSKASDIVAHGYYSAKDVQKAAELLIEYMKSKGYLSAKLITINHHYVLRPRKIDSNKSVDISIYLYEGEQTVVRNVQLYGNRALSTPEIEKILGIARNKPLNLFAFTNGIQNLKAAYRDRGYLSIRIANENTDTVVTYSEENRVADISLEIVEGPQYRVGDISIDGLVQTKPYVVQRELLFHPGQVLKQSEISGSEARLHRLGIFSVITIRATDDPVRPNIKNIKISVQEGTPGLIAGGIGIRNDLGVRTFMQLGYQNLWGENHTLILNAAANHRFQDFHFAEYETQLAYVYPWFLGGNTTFRPTATLSGTQYIDFDAVTAQLALTWERRLLKKPHLSALFTYSLERVIQFNSPYADENQGLRIGSVIPQLRLDMRNSPLNPTSGFYASASYEFASPYLLSQHDPFPLGYSLAMLRTDYYIPITRKIDWYLSFRTGYERTIESQQYDGSGNLITNSGQIPLIKQFALGGIGSVRGYQDQEINAGNSNVFALSFVNYRTELDLPFAGALKIAGFMDAANLLIGNTYSFSKDLLYGAGFGLRYVTPVGPVNLDWGFKLNPEPNTDTQQFYFSIGVI